MAELAVLNRALPVAEKARVQKAQRSESSDGSVGNSGHRKSHAGAAAGKTIKYAGVAELADALALGASGKRCAGSSPVTRTIITRIF